MINVIKRDGTKEPLDLNKFHKVTNYACENLAGVSVSDLEIKTHIQFYNGMQTSDIQEIKRLLEKHSDGERKI